MATSNSKSSASEGRLFVLALGLLAGFVLAFVFLLSRLPVDGIISQYNGASASEAEVSELNFDYYSVLPEQDAARKPERQLKAIEPPVVFMEPPSRPLSRTPLAAKSQIEQSASSVQAPVQPKAQPQPQVQSRPEIQTQPQVQSRPEIQTQPQVQSRPEIQTQPQDRPKPQLQVREMLASKTGQDSYFVEAGNYLANDDALRVQSVLLAIGVEAFIVVRQDSTGGFGHRVRIGPFFEQSRLDATREKLRASGISPKLIRVKG